MVKPKCQHKLKTLNQGGYLEGQRGIIIWPMYQCQKCLIIWEHKIGGLVEVIWE